MNEKKIAVLLPCYNEAGAIGPVIKDFRAIFPEADIYVYDNNSSDNTAEEAREAGAIVRFEARQGKGNVIRSMFMEIEADYYIMADGDGTYDSKVCPKMLEKFQVENLAMLIGVRKSKGSKTYRFGHVWGNILFTKFTKLLFGKGVNDIFSGYRIFSKRFVKSFPITASGFEIEMEMTAHALNLKLPVDEMSCDYFNRAAGTVSKLSTYKDGFKIVLFIVQLLKEYRPFFMFNLLAIIPAIFSLVLFYPVLINYLDHGTIERIPTIILCSGLGILSFILFCCGVILNSIARLNFKRGLQAYLTIKNEE